MQTVNRYLRGKDAEGVVEKGGDPEFLAGLPAFAGGEIAALDFGWARVGRGVTQRRKAAKRDAKKEGGSAWARLRELGNGGVNARVF